VTGEVIAEFIGRAALAERAFAHLEGPE